MTVDFWEARGETLHGGQETEEKKINYHMLKSNQPP